MPRSGLGIKEKFQIMILIPRDVGKIDKFVLFRIRAFKGVNPFPALMIGPALPFNAFGYILRYLFVPYPVRHRKGCRQQPLDHSQVEQGNKKSADNYRSYDPGHTNPRRLKRDEFIAAIHKPEGDDAGEQNADRQQLVRHKRNLKEKILDCKRGRFLGFNEVVYPVKKINEQINRHNTGKNQQQISAELNKDIPVQEFHSSTSLVAQGIRP